MITEDKELKTGLDDGPELPKGENLYVTQAQKTDPDIEGFYLGETLLVLRESISWKPHPFYHGERTAYLDAVSLGEMPWYARYKARGVVGYLNLNTMKIETRAPESRSFSKVSR